jgi:hypothetical protein
MAGIKYSPHGATVSVDSVDIEGITNISVGGGDVGEAETTDSDSAGVREYVAGLSDSGEVTIEMRHVPGATGQANLRTLKASRAIVECEIALPPSATDDSEVGTLTFDCYVRGFDWEFPTAEDAAGSATCVLRVTGAITEAVA